MDKFINDLKSDLNRNYKKIDKNSFLIKEMNLLNLKDRIGRIALLGTLVYLPVLFILFTLNIPGALYPIACLGGTFAIGVLGNQITEKKFKCKERVKNVLKNGKDKTKETIKLQMENEKLKIRNEIINDIISKYKEESKIIKRLSSNSRFSLNMKKSNYTNEELINKINELEIELQNKFNYLDNLLDESVLRNKKEISNYILNDLFYSMMASVVPLMLSVMPIFTYTIRPLSSPSLIPMISTLSVAAATFIGSMAYFISNRSKETKAIDSINQERKIIKNKKISNEIVSVKSTITNLIYTLHSYKIELEANELDKLNNKDKKKIYDCEQDFTLDNEKKLTLN